MGQTFLQSEKSFKYLIMSSLFKNMPLTSHSLPLDKLSPHLRLQPPLSTFPLTLMFQVHSLSFSSSNTHFSPAAYGVLVLSLCLAATCLCFTAHLKCRLLKADFPHVPCSLPQNPLGTQTPGQHNSPVTQAPRILLSNVTLHPNISATKANTTPRFAHNCISDI